MGRVLKEVFLPLAFTMCVIALATGASEAAYYYDIPGGPVTSAVVTALVMGSMMIIVVAFQVNGQLAAESQKNAAKLAQLEAEKAALVEAEEEDES